MLIKYHNVLFAGYGMEILWSLWVETSSVMTTNRATSGVVSVFRRKRKRSAVSKEQNMAIE